MMRWVISVIVLAVLVFVISSSENSGITCEREKDILGTTMFVGYTINDEWV